MNENTEEIIKDIIENPIKTKKKVGRPLGATKEKFSVSQRLKVLKDIALDKTVEQRIKLAAIDLYTKISGDALKVQEGSTEGSIVGIEFSKKSITAPPLNKVIDVPPVIKIAPKPVEEINLTHVEKTTTTTTTKLNSFNVTLDVDINPHWTGGIKPEDL